MSSETEVKIEPLSDQLVSLFAGSPTKAKELNLLYKAYLQTHDLTEPDLTEQLMEPVEKLRLRMADSYVQRKIGMKYAEFIAKFEDSTWKQGHLTNIDKHCLRTDLIIAGFIGAIPVLVGVQKGQAALSTNFVMVGAGSYVAECGGPRFLDKKDPLP